MLTVEIRGNGVISGGGGDQEGLDKRRGKGGRARGAGRDVDTRAMRVDEREMHVCGFGTEVGADEMLTRA